MGYKKDVDDDSGNIPEFGAIFMSNTATKRECMKKGVFGLPLAHADFVKQVKAGMILFLFEFERRQIFGVFRAVSDGKINVMPNAFRSSGKNFPAQVQFTQIWNCSPLSEYEFRDAIRDNYYSPKKFKFGLSEDQVHRLLLLFSSRKLKRELPDRRSKSDGKPIHEERRRLDDARISINNRVRFEPDMPDNLGDEILTEHDRNSLEKVTSGDHHLLHSRGDARQSKNKIYYDKEQVLRTRTCESRVKRTKVESEARFLVNDVAGKVHYDDHSPRQGTRNKYFYDSGGAGRIMDEGEMNNNLEPIVARGHTRNSLSGVGVSNKDGYWLNGHIHDIGSGMISSENYDNHEATLADTDNFLIDNFGERNQHDMDIRGTIFTKEHLREYQRERKIDSGTYFLNNRNSLGPDMSTEHFGISMGRGTREADDIRFPVIEKDHVGSILAEHPSGIARSSTDLGIYPIRERFKHDHRADNTLGLATSKDYSRFDLVEDRRMGGGSRFRESDMEETGSQLGTYRGHANISPPYISKSPYTGSPSLQTEISSPMGKAWSSSLFSYTEDHYIPHFPLSESLDATRAVPYDPDVPDICRGHSSVTAVIGLGSRPVQDLSFYQGSRVSPSSSRMRKSSPYQPKGSMRCFDTPDHGDTNSMPNHQEASYRTINASTMDENSEFKTSTQEDFNFPFYPDPSAHFPLSKVETTENDGDRLFSNSHFSNTKCEYDAGSSGKYSYTAGEGTNAERFPLVDMGRVKMQNGASFSEASLLSHKDPIDQDSNFCRSREYKVSCTNNRRKSVFARLSSAPEARMHDQDDVIDAVDDANDMDTSVENIMATLQHGLGHQVKIRNNNVNLKQPDDKGIANSKKTITLTSDQEFEHLNLKTDQSIEEIGGSILEETRHKDFKRRSKAKKNPEGSRNESSAGNVARKRLVEADAGEIESLGKTAIGNVEVDSSSTVSSGKRRRRLVRPVFSKKESDGGLSYYDVTENLHGKYDKEQERNHQEPTECCENSSQVASQKTAEAEKSSVNFHPPSRCPEGESKSYEPQEAQDSIITDPCKHKSNCCGWIEC